MSWPEIGMQQLVVFLGVFNAITKGERVPHFCALAVEIVAEGSEIRDATCCALAVAYPAKCAYGSEHW
jgi:hypothetical protein